MAIPLPSLDDRKWTDLVLEGRALVPRYAPAWTDHNVHDPGITILELLAWRTEISVYRLNRISPRHIRKFLKLAGVENAGPLAANVILSFGPFLAGSSFELKAGVQFESQRIQASAIPFATTRGINLERVTLAALLTHNAAGIWRDLSGESRDGHHVTILGVPPQPGAAAYFGFEDLPAGVPVSMGLWFGGQGNDWAERNRILSEVLAQQEACTPLHSTTVCPGATPVAEAPLFMPPKHHSARIVWEISTGAGSWTQLKQISMANRPSIGEVADDTRSLTLDGIVEFNVPPSATKVAVGPNPTLLFYLRARLAKGGYDTPVILRATRPNSTYAIQSVPLWQTLPIKAGIVPVNPAPAIGTFTAVNFSMNAAGEIDSLTFLPASTPGVPSFRLLTYAAPGVGPGSITFELCIPGLGTDVPMQQIFLPAAPVKTDTLRLYTHNAGVWTSWTRRDDFDSSLPSDRHFIVAPTDGTVTFGDGDRGRTASVDHLIVVAAETTQAVDGNVRAETIDSVSESPENSAYLATLSPLDMLQLRQHVTNVYAATDGVDDPSIETLALTAASALHAHERLTDLALMYTQDTLDQIPMQQVRTKQPPGNAVNIVDIERIALDTPGTRIRRVRAWPNHHPSLQCFNAVGFVTVLVIPDMPTPQPTPTQGLLDAVRRHLEMHRIVCMQIAVTGPTYVVISVNTRVRMKQGANAARVTDAIRRAIDTFLDARMGGPAGRGWPFGRSIYRSEILQLIDNVPGVDHVIALSLTAGSGKPQCGDIPLCNTWLPSPGVHTISASRENP